MKPYKASGKYWQLQQESLRMSGAALCPTRAAAGAKFTLLRKNSSQAAHRWRNGVPVQSTTAFTLAYYGTFDTLAKSNKMKAYRAKHFKTVTITKWVRKSDVARG